MAYAIELQERISAAIPRLVTERITMAEDQLRDMRASSVERIHNARKRFKEIRAVLRLARRPLGALFTSGNATFRGLGQQLASLRDADAMLEAVERLAEETAGFHERRVLRSVRRSLQRSQRAAAAAEMQPRIDAVLAELAVARTSVGLWPELPSGFAAVREGLRRTYRDGRRRFEAVLVEPAPLALHEWRKRVKDHWYHASIFRNFDPLFSKPYREALEGLSRLLGERHDLDLIRERVTHLESRDAAIFSALLDRVASRLTAEALTAGGPIFAARPVAISETFEAAWQTGAPLEELIAEGVAQTGT